MVGKAWLEGFDKALTRPNPYKANSYWGTASGSGGSISDLTVSWDETGTGTISSKPLSLSYSIKTTPSITYGGSTYGASFIYPDVKLISEPALWDLANALVKERYPDYDPSR
jgi:hypothetical protein